MMALVAAACATPLAASPSFRTCTPTLPMYCANIHVGCAGRTRLPTHPFTFEGSEVHFADNSIWRVSVRRDERATVLRRIGTRDWIRIQTDGAYSIRIYRKGRALMTLGECV